MGDRALRGNKLTAAKGGRAGHAHGMTAGKRAIMRVVERLGGGEEGKPHSTQAGRLAAGVRRIKRGAKRKKRFAEAPWTRQGAPDRPGRDFKEGGRIGLKKGSVHEPGSHSWYLQQIHKPRKSKAVGGRAGYFAPLLILRTPAASLPA